MHLLTPRLTFHPFTSEDAPFILTLLNTPGFLQFIGDRGVRTLEDARQYLQNGPMTSYRQHGFGLYRTDLTETQTPIGMCGLIKRDGLDDVDLGYAFLPAYEGQGYATEAASAMMTHAQQLGIPRVVAITAPDNERSIRVLEKIGLRFEKMITLPNSGESKLFTPLKPL